MWKRLMKWAAGKAFTWGLKQLTEKYGEKPEQTAKRPKVVRHRKPYVN